MASPYRKRKLELLDGRTALDAFFKNQFNNN